LDGPFTAHTAENLKNKKIKTFFHKYLIVKLDKTRLLFRKNINILLGPFTAHTAENFKNKKIKTFFLTKHEIFNRVINK